MIKILKNVTKIVELAMKVEKSNCKSKSKLIKIKHVGFRETLPASFELPLKMTVR